MKAEILGIRKVNFTDRNTGNAVTGRSYFYSYMDDQVEGVAANSVFVTDQRYAQLTYHPAVGDHVRLEFNRYGKVSDILEL